MGLFSYASVGLLVLMLIVAAVKRLCRFLSTRHNGPEIPSPSAYPILRHLPYFFHGSTQQKSLFMWSEMFKKEGIFKFDPLMGAEMICIFKEEFVKHVLVKNCSKYARPKTLTEPFPNMEKGLLVTNGKEHAWQRKLLHPTFSLASIISFVEVFDTNINNLMKCWRDKAKDSLSGVAEVDIHRDLTRLTLDVIGEAAFGYNFNTLTTGENRVSKAVERILSGKFTMLSRILRRYIPFYDMIPLKENVELRQAADIANGIVTDIIKKKREMLRSGMDASNDVSKDLLGKMLLLQDKETGEGLSDEVIDAQVHTFMIAGHETTSVGLTWVFYLLAKHPAVQEKAREEARSILGNSTIVKKEHVEKLRYITAVVNESFRLYPPVSAFGRNALQDDEIGGYKIPKGAQLFILISAVHHMEEFWPNPKQFLPERFLAEDGKQPEIGNYKFMPFSNGPRNCIGRRFAVMEMKVALLKLLVAFKFELSPTQEEISARLVLTLKPDPKPILRVSPID